MRRILVTLAATAFAVPMMAGTAFAVEEVTSSNANENACFGQIRAYNSANNGAGSTGEVASSRKGEQGTQAYRNGLACRDAL